uniref:Nucleocapsid protein n=1 Tax=Elaeophora elaphi TaxID=1147741 RepID=A0A0R3S2X8_9BILA
MDDATQAKDSTAEDDQMKSFVNSGRSGRRNAIPEVDARGVDPDATKLAERLSLMNTDGQDNYTVDDTTGNGIEIGLKLKVSKLSSFRCFATWCFLEEVNLFNLSAPTSHSSL